MPRNDGQSPDERLMLSNDRIVSELGGRWRSEAVLKRDIFSTIERGWFRDGGSEIDAVLRRIDMVPWWSRPIARHFLAREARALAIAGPLGIAPRLLHVTPDALVRAFIDGVPLHIAQPEGDAAYFRSAKAALRAMHGARLCHNDLAKEQNWLRGLDRRAYLTDFQLATSFSRRGRLFRLAAHEDLRHLLKHKRRYAPEALTSAERRMLARKSWPARVWLATGKRVYIWITRGLLNFADREGSGSRLAHDAPAIAAQLRSHPHVRDVAIVAFPDRRTGTGLYAFVEANGALSEREANEFLTQALGRTKAPEQLQLVDALPRNRQGTIRCEILSLIAMNQLDQIEPLITDEAGRAITARIIANRRNLRDRFNM
jgi:predicted Ser/Thr protein kinase